MKAFMKTKSIWGNPPKRLYNLIKLADENLQSNYTSCIVGCSDGKFLLPFARKNHYVTGYDIDKIALEGGEKLFPLRGNEKTYTYSKNFISKNFNLELRKVVGIKERLKIEKLEKLAQIEYLDFYKITPNKKFNFVFTSCSIHYSANQQFTLKQKIEKLQGVVAVKGYLYIDYMMAIDENDNEKWSQLKFFKKGEILNYFGTSWKIIFIKENNNPSFEKAHVDCIKDHFHRFGYILSRRIK